MTGTAHSFLSLLYKLPLTDWGISENRPSADFQYPLAVSLLLAYSYPIENYSPSDFHSFLIHTVKTALDNNVECIRLFLEENKVPYRVVTNIRKDKENLIGEYSQKMAAVRAGLGWIGKNTLLVTKDWGPRVRLATILVDLDLPATPPQSFRGCRDCTICVQCCPSQCLKGKNWDPDLKRKDMIDIALCGARNDAIKDCICGVCLLTCPVAQEDAPSDKRILYK